MKRDLAARALRLSSTRAREQAGIRYDFLPKDAEEVAEDYCLRCARLGVEAATLASALCETYGFALSDKELVSTLQDQFAYEQQLSDKRFARFQAALAQR